MLTAMIKFQGLSHKKAIINTYSDDNKDKLLRRQ